MATEGGVRNYKRFHKGDLARGERSGNLYRILSKHIEKITYYDYDVSWIVENLATGEQKNLRDTYLTLEVPKGEASGEVVVVALLKEDGWVEDGATQQAAYKTASPAYGGGSVVKTGGRLRLRKGDWSATVGKRTVCFSRKPENPETLTGRFGKQVYTFRDWMQVNMPTKDLEHIRAFIAPLGEQP